MTLDDMAAYMGRRCFMDAGDRGDHEAATEEAILRTLTFIAKPNIQEAIRAAHDVEKAKTDPAVRHLMDTFPGQVILRHASE
jgi:hypothetical protein